MNDQIPSYVQKEFFLNHKGLFRSEFIKLEQRLFKEVFLVSSPASHAQTKYSFLSTWFQVERAFFTLKNILKLDNVM